MNSESTANHLTATYSPDDNKLRLYSWARLDPDTYSRVSEAGFKRAPKQNLFVAPMWTPARADLLMELCGEIGDEDTSLVERAGERAERFERYSANRAADAEAARKQVDRIANGIPLGQPILVGHHSERHARRDADRIHNGMQRAVKMWETSQYWGRRAAAALFHAKYKEEPAVRARRIKTIEADKRKQERARTRATNLMAAWNKLGLSKNGRPLSPENIRPHAIYLANMDGGYYRREHTFPSGYIGPLSLWEAVGGNIHDNDPDEVAVAAPEEVRDQAIKNHQSVIAGAERWIQHYELRLAYERAMLGETGGTPADRTQPERGGACQCWASPRGGWSYIQRVNKVSVTVLDNWGNGGPNFPRTIPFDKLSGVMAKAQVEDARATGRLLDSDFRDANGTVIGFFLRAQPPINRDGTTGAESTTHAAVFEAMRETLNAVVQIVSAPNLFPTPTPLAMRMIALAEIGPTHRVLEPSAGTGALVDVIVDAAGNDHQSRGAAASDHVVAVEIDITLANRLRGRFPGASVCGRDFLNLSAQDLGLFDRILMNPPFDHGSDITHILHAYDLLAPAGRLIAICANGPHQQETLRPLVEACGGLWEELPPDTFRSARTSVRTVLLAVSK